MHPGLWKSWIIKMMRGEMAPAKPTEPEADHIKNKERVAYTPAEMTKRWAAYQTRRATWKKTMKVIMVFACHMTHLHQKHAPTVRCLQLVSRM
jgi:hypothetical protein